MLASGSYDNTVRLWTLLNTDITGDGQVNLADIVEVAKNYGKTAEMGANAQADINRDGRIDVADLIAITSAVDQRAALKNPQQPATGSLTEENIWE